MLANWCADVAGCRSERRGALLHWSRPMRRNVLATLSAILLIAMLAGPAVAKAPKPMPPPDSSDIYPAGLVCPFQVRLDGWSNEKVKVIVDRQCTERMVVTGSARTLVTDTETGDSLRVRTHG